MSLSYSSLEDLQLLNVPSMPTATQLGYQSNNLYDNFPPLMSDGRTIIASYQPDAITNEQLLKDNGIQTNWEYRKYLQTNAREIMQKNCMSMSNDIGYVRRYDGDNSVKNVPYTFKNANQRVVGLPGYSDSDLKSMYLTREELNSRTNTATMPETQQNILKYR
jgi:hypothetical protein